MRQPRGSAAVLLSLLVLLCGATRVEAQRVTELRVGVRALEAPPTPRVPPGDPLRDPAAQPYISGGALVGGVVAVAGLVQAYSSAAPEGRPGIILGALFVVPMSMVVGAFGGLLVYQITK
jgi:hypothetical protein